MGLVITEAMPGFAAEVVGLDLRRPIGDEDFAEIQEAIDRQAVLVFRGQMLSDLEQVAFSRWFGPPELDVGRHGIAPAQRPEVSYITNTDAEGNKLPSDARKVVNGRGNEAWHTDSSSSAFIPRRAA